MIILKTNDFFFQLSPVITNNIFIPNKKTLKIQKTLWLYFREDIFKFIDQLLTN